MRVFVTVSSTRPLVVDLFALDAVARYAREPYDAYTLTTCRQFTTLHNTAACHNKLPARCMPSKLSKLFDLISKEAGFDISPLIWQKIADRALRVAMLARERSFEARKQASRAPPSRARSSALNIGNSFQLIGLDTVLESDGTLMVFEANASPSLYPRWHFMNFTHFVESHLRCVGLIPPAAGSVSHVAGYRSHVLRCINAFRVNQGHEVFSALDVALLADIARRHDEPMHDGHWRIYPSLESQFSAFAPLVERWPPASSWVEVPATDLEQQKQSTVADRAAREFLEFYAQC